MHAENAQVRLLRHALHGQVQAMKEARTPSEEDDPFAGLDTPKDSASAFIRKLCMVCMDNERGRSLTGCILNHYSGTLKA